MSEVTALAGGWVNLEPLTSAHSDEVESLELVRRRTPNLGGATASSLRRPGFGLPMLIRERRGGQAVGIVENHRMTGYPGVAVVTIFVDPAQARPGVAMEAFAIYLRHVFDSGARLVHFEVLDSNAGVLRMLRTIGAAASARMREHLYVGGSFHDVLVFSLTRQQFELARARYSSMLPGGDRPPAALGGVRRDRDGKSRQK